MWIHLKKATQGIALTQRIKKRSNQSEPPGIMKNMCATFEIETNLPYRPSFETHNYLIDQKVNKEVSEILTAALTDCINQAISNKKEQDKKKEEDMQLCSIEVLSVDYFQPDKDDDVDKDGQSD